MTLPTVRCGEKRILMCSDSFYPVSGGGDISFREVARHLKNHCFDVHACYIGGACDPEFAAHPIKISTLLRGTWPRMWAMHPRWMTAISDMITHVKPEVVITQQTSTAPSIEACVRAELPVIVFLRDVSMFCLGAYWKGAPWKCHYRCIGCKNADGRLAQYPFFRREITKLNRLLSVADLVVANSNFMKRTIAEVLGLDSVVLTPGIPSGNFSSQPPRDGKTLFFTPLDYKGVDTAIALAKRLETEEFLFVGESRPRTIAKFSRLDNVEYIPWTTDVASCYKKSRLLIVPSIIPEAFGRVCVEAMMRGIPCIGSGLGALPDTIGTGGDIVAHYSDVEDWIATLNRYGNPVYYSEKSGNALRESSRYSAFDSKRLISAVNEVIEH